MTQPKHGLRFRPCFVTLQGLRGEVWVLIRSKRLTRTWALFSLPPTHFTLNTVCWQPWTVGQFPFPHAYFTSTFVQSFPTTWSPSPLIYLVNYYIAKFKQKISPESLLSHFPHGLTGLPLFCGHVTKMPLLPLPQNSLFTYLPRRRKLSHSKEDVILIMKHV